MFERENRYVVLKIKDINKYLPYKLEKQLESIMFQIALGRAKDDKYALDCVVVENDWPEYEPTWKAIEERMTNGTKNN